MAQRNRRPGHRNTPGCESDVKEIFDKYRELIMDRDVDLVSGDTDNHLILVDLTRLDISGKAAEYLPGQAGITLNRNAILFETKTPFVTSGIRIGTPNVTSRGIKTARAEIIATPIADLLKHPEDMQVIDRQKGPWPNFAQIFPSIRTVMSRTDIRDKIFLTGDEVRRLNFISDSPDRHFRMHYRQGLRSLIFEVLWADDVLKETEGDVVDGVRWYPRAVPRYMLRILRTRLASLEEALDEVKKYTLVLKYLGPELIARSNEFIVEYTGTGKSEILLCGLQEYIEGAMLDPWVLFDESPLERFYLSKFPEEKPDKERVPRALDSIASFVERTRKMFLDTGYIPDLAGNGNLILTPGGGIKLVDINNIIKIDLNDTVHLDDKGYPSCDKAVEVLAILEEKFLNVDILPDDPLYGHFLTEERKKEVRRLEEKFYRSLSSLSP